MVYRHRAPAIPRAFIERRTHSLMGLWLVVFLIEHLLTNSQAALFIGDDGSGFVHAVNAIKNLPYLPAIELFLLGIPLLMHGWWGIRYMRSAEYNIWPTEGSTPSLPHNPRNHAYTWQRITSWVLLIGIFAHVIQMRFWQYPTSAQIGSERQYMMRVTVDEGLYTLSKRMGFTLYNRQQIEESKQRLLSSPDIAGTPDGITSQTEREANAWIAAMEKWPLQPDDLVAVCPSFGLAELLMVRDTFKSPTMMLLYTALVGAACFHAFNGLWTFMITWGVTTTFRSQQLVRRLVTTLMVLISLLGWSAIWGTYWWNLKL